MAEKNLPADQFDQPEFQPRGLLDYLFEIGTIIKIIDSFLEAISGFVLLFIKVKTITSVIGWLTADELASDPDDLVANWLTQTANHLAINGKLFIAIYLITHGVVKIILLTSLLRNKFWAYPATIVLMSSFILFQSYKLSVRYSLGFTLLTFFDITLLLLIIYEYWKVIRGHKVLKS